MKTIASALVALSVLAGMFGMATSVSAATVAEQLESEGRFGHAI